MTDPEALKQMTPEALIGRALELKNFMTNEQKRLKDHLDPSAKEEEAIRNELLRRLNEPGAPNSFPCDTGTAYTSTLLNAKLVDRDVFLKFVSDNWTEYGGAMLMCSAQVDSVKEFMEKHEGNPPPGLEASWFKRLNIRKS